MAAIEIDTEINNYINENNLSIVVFESYEGITQTKGCNSGLTDINPYFLVLDIETNEQFILMEINENIYTKLSLESIDKVKETNSSWFLCKNGYIASNFNGLQIYLHQYLMNLFGQGKGSTSIDHINRDKLDNRYIDLKKYFYSIYKILIWTRNKDKKPHKDYQKELLKLIYQNTFTIVQKLLIKIVLIHM